MLIIPTRGGYMEHEGKKANSDDYQGNDRRNHNNLRIRFETACRITAPFLQVENGMDGMPMRLSAIQTLRNYYPELSQQEIAILFSAVQNFHGISLRK